MQKWLDLITQPGSVARRPVHITEFSINCSGDHLNKARGVFITALVAAASHVICAHIATRQDGWSAINMVFMGALSLAAQTVNHVQPAIILHSDSREKNPLQKMLRQRVVTQEQSWPWLCTTFTTTPTEAMDIRCILSSPVT